jgi:hypothetical protein
MRNFALKPASSFPKIETIKSPSLVFCISSFPGTREISSLIVKAGVSSSLENPSVG